jgi:RNA polymerase sigma factor (sigma-70 family)
MDQLQDFSIERLSEPIEGLRLDARTYHALKRAGIDNILDIILLGEFKLVSVKGIGNLMATEISSAVAIYLSLSKDKVFGKEMKRIAYFQADKLLDVSLQPSISQQEPSSLISESNINQATDFSFEKFSDLIDLIGLEVNVIRRLNREGIQSVADLIAAGKRNILNIKNIGALAADRAFNSLSKHLGIPKEQLDSQEILKIAREETRKTQRTPFNISITTLVLPGHTFILLRDMGITRIEQLIEFRAGDSKTSELFNKNMLMQIDRALKWYRADVYKSGNYLEEPVKAINYKYPVINLNQAIQLLNLKERTWMVLEMRAIQQLTLEDIGEKLGGVSRERVRQIIALILEKLQKNIIFLEKFYDQLETTAVKNRELLLDGQISLEDLSGKLEKQMSDSGFGVIRKDLNILISIIRLLAVCRRE